MYTHYMYRYNKEISYSVDSLPFCKISKVINKRVKRRLGKWYFIDYQVYEGSKVPNGLKQ